MDVEPLAVALGILGASLVALGVGDVFLTILHPDRDGPLGRRLARGVWRLALALALRLPRRRREIVSLAGGLMMAATILLWISLVVVGMALIEWPRLSEDYARVTDVGRPSFVDALYYAGVTFTTLGFGDVTPRTALGQALAVVTAGSGFAIMTASITYILNVFSGMDRRDALALRMLAETSGTGDGARFVATSLRDEGPDRLATRLYAWADELRRLQEKLYRFQNVAFFLRSRMERHDPEPLLETITEAALAARLLAQRPDLAQLRPAAHALDITATLFMRSVGERVARPQARDSIEHPTPRDADERHLEAIWARVATSAGWRDEPMPAPDDETFALAARSRAFLDALDDVTAWRALR